MISVLNHLQPLSGNKSVLYLIIPVLLISCGAFRKSAPVAWPQDEEIVEVTPDNPSDKPKGDEKDKEDDNDKEDDKELVYSTVVFQGQSFKVPEHKDKFDIVVLLPFHADASNSRTDKRRSQIMLEYYQGLKLAMNEAKQLSSKFTIHIYDTDNDTNKLKELLKKPILDNADLIIGPTDEDQVRIAAYFAKKREIPLFSPLTTLNQLWSNNPFVYNLNPSYEMQAQEFLDYYRKYHKGEKLLIVRDGKRFDKAFGAALVAECERQKVEFSKIAFSSYITWEHYLGPDKTLVVSTAEDKTTLTYMITGLLNKSKNVTLVGSDKWLGFSNVDYVQWEKLKATFISTKKYEVLNDKAKKMVRNYRLHYKDDPSEYTYMGYDQLLFACEILDAFGGYFPLFVEGKEFNYAGTNFQLEKGVTCFYNRYLQMYRLKDHQLEVLD